MSRKSVERMIRQAFCLGLAVTKHCRKCGQDKPHSEMVTESQNLDGVTSRCKSCDRIAGRARRAKNPDLARERARAFYARHRDKVRQERQRYYEENKGKARAAVKEWKKKKPQAAKIYRNNRRAREAGCDLKSIPHDFEMTLLSRQKWRCACCSKSLKSGWHVDHIMPLALGGPHETSNLQLLCPPCNLSKGSRHPIDFMKSRGRLL